MTKTTLYLLILTSIAFACWFSAPVFAQTPQPPQAVESQPAPAVDPSGSETEPSVSAVEPSAPAEEPAQPPEEPSMEEQLLIKAIEFRGNVMVPDKDILSVMKGRAGDVFSLNTLSADVAAIDALGWFSAEPEHLLEPFEGGVKVIIILKENPVFHGVDITQNGPGIYPAGELSLLFKLEEGKLINNQAVVTGLAGIERRYRDDGYTAATVTSIKITDDGIIHIEITEGVIAEIVLQGNTKTRKHVILREMTTKPGDVFNAVTFRRDLEKVYNLQLFEDIQPSFKLNDDKKVVVYINLVEAKTGQLGFGAGYSSNDGLMATVSYSERNFRGVGQRLTAMGQIGGPNPDFEVSFFNPVIDSQKTSLSIDTFIFNESDRLRDATDETIVTPFDMSRRGGSVGVVRPMNEFVTLALTLKFLDGRVTFKDAEGNPLPPDQIPDISDNDWVSKGLIDGTANSLIGRVAYDTRDFTLDPARGSLASLQTSMIGQFLGGDFDAMKYELELRHYFPLTKEKKQDTSSLSPTHGTNIQVLALRAMYGTSTGDLPLIERFEIGGQNSVRGAEETAQAGDQAMLFNAEYRFPLGGNLHGAIFFDAGTAAEPDSSLSFDNMIKSIGIGVRYRISFFGIAPLRLDYGYDLDEKVGRITFGFGQLF
jgi:outer membrane protein insertion porin family